MLFGKCLLVCLLKYPQHTGTGLKCLSKYDVIKLPPPTSTPNDDTVGKEGWGGENVSESDGVILGCSLICFYRHLVQRAFVAAEVWQFGAIVVLKGCLFVKRSRSIIKKSK